MGKLFAFATRGFQLICSVIVLGVSANLIRGQKHGGSPIVLYLGAVAGALGFIASIWGIVSAAFSIEKPKISLILDGISAFLLLAMGLAFAVSLKAHSCNDYNFTAGNKILNAGSKDHQWDSKNEVYWMYEQPDNWGKSNQSPPFYLSRCRAAGADTAFMFIGFLSFAVVIVWGLLKGRKSGDKYVV